MSDVTKPLKGWAVIGQNKGIALGFDRDDVLDEGLCYLSDFHTNIDTYLDMEEAGFICVPVTITVDKSYD